MGTVRQPGLWSTLGNHGFYVFVLYNVHLLKGDRQSDGQTDGLKDRRRQQQYLKAKTGLR